MTPTTADTVRAMFARILKVPESDIDISADLYEVYGLDSLDALKLLSKLEVEFDITLAEDQTAKIRSLTDVVALVDELRLARGYQP